jgi:hypothetical protein
MQLFDELGKLFDKELKHTVSNIKSNKGHRSQAATEAQ